MPQREKTFARNEVFPSWWTNTVGAFLSTHASPNFVLRKASATTIEVPAGTNDDMVGAAIDGRMRWVEATVTRAHPGGVAGTYDVFLTAADDVIVNTPQPYTDNTARAFALAIVAAGATPTITAGVVDIHRKIGSVIWDGAAITEVRPDFGAQARRDSFAAADPVERSGVTGQTQPRWQRQADGAMLWGDGTAAPDVKLYRSGADTLKTDDHMRSAVGFMVDTASGQHAFRAVQAAGSVLLRNYLLAADAQPSYSVGGDGSHQWGPGGAAGLDVNLYRATPGVFGSVASLATDDNFFAAGKLAAEGNLVPRSMQNLSRFNSGIGTASASTNTVFNHSLGASATLVLLTSYAIGMSTGGGVNYDIPNATQFRVYNPQAFAFSFAWAAFA